MLDDPHKSKVLFGICEAASHAICGAIHAGNHPSHQPDRLRRADPLVPYMHASMCTTLAHAHTHADLNEPTSVTRTFGTSKSVEFEAKHVFDFKVAARRWATGGPGRIATEGPRDHKVGLGS